MKRQVVHIAGASGAWGDSPLAIGQLLQEDVHYLMMDYLAEVTMSLLAKAKMKDPPGGLSCRFCGLLKTPFEVHCRQRHQGRLQHRA